MSELQKLSGIYRIKNLETGAMYIGQTSQPFGKRWCKHRWELGAGCHHNDHLQNSYNKHGLDAFEFKALEVIPQGDMSDQRFSDYMNEREIILIAEYDTFSNGYNLSEGGGGKRGYEMGESTRAKMSKSQMGNANGKGCKGNRLTSEHKASVSRAMRGRKLSEEHIANMSKALTGRKLSEEHTTNMSAARRGKKLGPPSAEHRAALSKTHKGKPWSEARRAAEEARKGRL